MALTDVINALVSCLSGQCVYMGRVNLQIERHASRIIRTTHENTQNMFIEHMHPALCEITYQPSECMP